MSEPVSQSDQEYIAQLHAEAAGMSPDAQREHLEMVAELTGRTVLSGTVESDEVDLLSSEFSAAEAAQAQADRYIEEAKALAAASTKTAKSETDDEPTKVTVDFDKIGWIRDEGKKEIESTVVETPELTYDLIDLIDMNPTTKAQYEKLQAQTTNNVQNLNVRLMSAVSKTVIPKVHRGILQGSNLRSISIGGRTKKQAKPSQSLNTSYPAFKEDVFGTSNRVIIMRVDDRDSVRPAYAVVALYDHDDDKAIHSELFLKQK